VPFAAALIAVPFPFKRPVTDVEMVRTGLAAFVKEPAKPFDEETEKVEVATQFGMPFAHVRTVPGVPVPNQEEVATAIGTPVPEPPLKARPYPAAIGERPIVAFVPPTSAPAFAESVRPLLPVNVVVATDWYAVLPPYKSCETGAVVLPVPPLPMPRVPEIVLSVVVATHVGMPLAMASTCPFVPFAVADTAELPFPERRPVNVPKMGAEVLKVCCPVHVFA
jgi:hypothetical protein